jgi:hypothetical protein
MGLSTIVIVISSIYTYIYITTAHVVYGIVLPTDPSIPPAHRHRQDHPMDPN